MSDYYRDLYRRPDGSVGWVETTLPKMHTRAFCDADGMVYTLWRDNDTDRVFQELEGIPLTLQVGRSVKGNFPCAYDEKGAMYLQHDDDGVLTRYFRPDWVSGHIAAPYAAEGVWSVRSDGHVVMRNDPSRFRTLPNGEFGHNICETENFIVYQFGRDPDYGGSFSCYDKRTGETRRWLGYSPHAPVAMEDSNGKLWVAISGRDTPAPDQVEWALEFPPLPTPAPIGITPDYPQTLRPIWRGCLGWDGGPGNFAGGRNHGGRPIVEGTGREKDGTAWVLPADEPNLTAIFTSPHEARDRQADEDDARVLSKRTGAPILLYSDRNVWDLRADGERLNAAGCAVIPTVRCYPTAGTWDVLDRLKESIHAAHPLRVAVVRPLYAQPQWDETDAARLNVELTKFIESSPDVCMDLAFGWKRPQGSWEFKVWAESYFLGLCERTPHPDRNSLPRTVRPGESPAPPVEPEQPLPAPTPVPDVAKSSTRLKDELARLRTARAAREALQGTRRPWWKILFGIR